MSDNSISTNAPILTIFNQHLPDSGIPPLTSNAVPHLYIGYFANEHREQWVFTYDYDTHQAELLGGDAGWEQRYPVVDGHIPTLLLGKSEMMWLQACWYAATR
jgi:hypothetical protein